MLNIFEILTRSKLDHYWEPRSTEQPFRLSMRLFNGVHLWRCTCELNQGPSVSHERLTSRSLSHHPTASTFNQFTILLDNLLLSLVGRHPSPMLPGFQRSSNIGLSRMSIGCRFIYSNSNHSFGVWQSVILAVWPTQIRWHWNSNLRINDRKKNTLTIKPMVILSGCTISIDKTETITDIMVNDRLLLLLLLLLYNDCLSSQKYSFFRDPTIISRLYNKHKLLI